MHSSDSVCLCVCVCAKFSKVMNGFMMKFHGELGRGPGRNRLDFGGDPNSFVYRLSFSRILYY